jgi:plasmid stabilization system protein ParE
VAQPPSFVSGYVLTPQAKADIFEIWRYIARDNENAADRVEVVIFRALEFIAEGPERGHTRLHLTHRPVRFWTVLEFPNYVIA